MKVSRWRAGSQAGRWSWGAQQALVWGVRNPLKAAGRALDTWARAWRRVCPSELGQCSVGGRAAGLGGRGASSPQAVGRRLETSVLFPGFGHLDMWCWGEGDSPVSGIAVS